MRKQLAALAALVFLAIASCLVYGRWFRIPAGARTLYSGSVSATPATLAEREARLQARGCRPLRGGKREALCMYERGEAGQGKEALVVYPRGLGFGPVAIVLTRDRLLASKDIPGRPDEEAFRRAVRADARELGDVVQIVEGTWTMSEVTCPWTVVY